ncbi:ribonuclease H-like domain-containing protein, partial [Tanacetum coccineum]
MTDLNNVSKDNSGSWVSKRGNQQQALKNKGIFDSGCSRHMIGNKDFLTDYQELDGGFVAFGGSARELKFNLFSVLQICDKKNIVFFTETECLVLSPDFKLLDESQVLLRVPKQSNMYSFDLKNVVPSGDLTLMSLNYGIGGWVMFSWVFFLASKDETSGILKIFITEIENQLSHKVKVIRCDNGTKFKNREMNEFCGSKGIKMEFSVARTPQQNGVAKRKNRTLIEAARTMLADSLLPTIFWVEAVNTACYVLNRVLVTKPHNKTPYELIIGRPPSISFMRPFGCPVTILNTLDPLGKFDGKAEEGYLVGRMPFGLCNAPTTFQRCMLEIFHDMIEESIEVFMDNFSVFGNSFDKCLNNLDKMLQLCKDSHLVLNWEKCRFMVKEGIMLGQKVSSAGLEVDKAKINVISKLPPPTNIKGVRIFLGHASFYRHFIKDFSKMTRPLTKLLEKDTLFEFDDECQKAFKILKDKITCALVIVSPNWNLPFKLMCDASDCAVGAVLEFDIEIKDRKGIENVAADHLSRIENDESSDDSEVDDNFLGETLMEINT